MSSVNCEFTDFSLQYTDQDLQYGSDPFLFYLDYSLVPMRTQVAVNKKKKAGLPLKLRLKAWWEGYDADEIRQRIVERMPEEESKAVEAPAAPDKSKSSLVEEELNPWDAEKLNIAQYIWGEGFCGPGGPDYIITLSKLMALSPEMSMLQLGAGIGGPARVLVEKFGVWITGYEESDILVEKGREMSKMAGMEKKADIHLYDPEDFEGFDRKFDRAFARETLFTIQDKEQIIAELEENLKPGGLFLITDYMLGSDAVIGTDTYKQWRVGERSTPYPCLVDDMVDLLKKYHFQVRVNEDISDQYIDMINHAWAGADETAAALAKQENGPKLIQTLMREAEFWTRRKKMLESGDLKLHRLVANKKSGGPGAMSDW